MKRLIDFYFKFSTLSNNIVRVITEKYLTVGEGEQKENWLYFKLLNFFVLNLCCIYIL